MTTATKRLKFGDVPGEVEAAAAALVERSRRAQNLPLVVEDERILRKVATLARDWSKRSSAS